MACSGEDPVYWYDAGSSEGTTGGVPYYPEKPSENGGNQGGSTDNGDQGGTNDGNQKNLPEVIHQKDIPWYGMMSSIPHQSFHQNGILRQVAQDGVTMSCSTIVLMASILQLVRRLLM